MRRSLGLVGMMVLTGACSTDPAAALCHGVTGTCTGIIAGATDNTVQAAAAKLTDGSTLVFAAGTFKLNTTLTITAKNVTLTGQGMDKTILDFTASRSDLGVSANRDGFTIQDLTVENTFGDAVKVVGATGVTFQRVHVLWMSSNLQGHGAYGLYPVQCTNVLLQDCKVEGASDAGIYVGQSSQIMVRRNTASGNVAGIEIENSHFADVTANTAQGNTAGILVFALPDLMVPDTANVRVYQNTTMANNGMNFATPGGVVSKVPAGVGLLVMAAANVEAFGNMISGNQTAQAAVVSYYLVDQNFKPAMHPGYYPYPSSVWLHDNTFTGGGNMPDQSNTLGVFLALTRFPGGIIPSILYDGIVDAAHTSTTGKNKMDLCLSGNGSATFANVHADNLAPPGFGNFSTDTTTFTCTLTPLPPVSFPGLTP